MASAQLVIFNTCTKAFGKDVWQSFGLRVVAGVIKRANDAILFSYVDPSFKDLDNNSSEIPLVSGISVSHRQPGFPDKCTPHLPSANHLTSSTQLVKIGRTRDRHLISIPLGLDRVIHIFDLTV